MATWHPAATRKVRKLRDEFERDVKQWLWRGMYGTRRWPEVCVKCEKDVESYDEQGVAWCRGHWKGVEVPRFREQLSLLDARAAVGA